MKSNWQTMTIDEVTDRLIDYRGKTPPKTDSGVRLITAKVVKGGRILDDKPEFIAADFYDQWMRRGLPQQSDVLITTEAPLGEVAILRRPERIALAQRIILLRGNPKIIDQKYLFYALQSEFTQGELNGRSTGTTVSGIKQSELRKVRLQLPDLPTQRKIAGILSAYDDLIENNLRRIRILEEMAQSLYREWFVHFRFPGHEGVRMVDSPLGRIPEGWEVKTLGDLAQEVRRGIPKGELKDPMPYVGLEHIPRQSLALDNWEIVSELGSNKLIFEPGEILFGKIRPYFHKVSVAPFLGVCSADTIVIRAKIPGDTSLVTACVSSEAFVAHASATANGAKMPRADWKVLVKYLVLLPPKKLKKTFSDFFENAVAEQQILVRRNQNLRQTRDLLLPKLLSGQMALRVSEPVTVEHPTPARASRPAKRTPVLEKTVPRPTASTPEAPPSIDDIARKDVLCAIRKLFSDGWWRDRETALKELSQALGYRRLGPHIREVLSTDLLTAVRRGILTSEGGEYTLGFRSLTDLPRDVLKDRFLSAVGRSWITRDDAIRVFARSLGFARTGDQIDQTARSLINGLIREGRLESDGGEGIRKA